MSHDALSAAIEEAYASAPTDAVILHTLELRHATFVDDEGNPAAIRVVADHQDLTATLEASAPWNPSESVTFIAFAFDIEPPEASDIADPEAVVRIDNVAPEIEEAIAAACETTTPVEITYRPFLSTDLTGPQWDPPLHLVARTIEADDLSITLRAGFGNFANRAYPTETYTLLRFPGLRR